MDSDFNKEICCATFNCLGFKGSHSLIEHLALKMIYVLYVNIG